MTVTTKNVTRNVTSDLVHNLAPVEGALVRLSNDGALATVLVRATGELVRVPADALTPTRGRPIKLIKGLTRADVDALLAEHPDFVHDCTIELFGRQTADEREVLSTRWDNAVGFRADDARRGSALALKSLAAWGDEEFSMARAILSRYSGTQLFDVASEYLAECEITTGALYQAPTETETALSEVMADLEILAALDASH